MASGAAGRPDELRGCTIEGGLLVRWLAPVAPACADTLQRRNRFSPIAPARPDDSVLGRVQLARDAAGDARSIRDKQPHDNLLKA